MPMSILPAILLFPLNHIKRTISLAWFFVLLILKGHLYLSDKLLEPVMHF